MKKNFFKFFSNVKTNLILFSLTLSTFTFSKEANTKKIVSGLEEVTSYFESLKDTIFYLVYLGIMIFLAWKMFEAYTSDQYLQIMKQLIIAVLVTGIMFIALPSVLKKLAGKNIDVKYHKQVIKKISLEKSKTIENLNFKL